jgi:hypothetical protein
MNVQVLKIDSGQQRSSGSSEVRSDEAVEKMDAGLEMMPAPGKAGLGIRCMKYGYIVTDVFLLGHTLHLYSI